VTVTTLDLHGKMTIEDAVFSNNHILSLSLSHIVGDLLINGATLSALDLSGASVGGNFTLGLSSSNRKMAWMLNTSACDERGSPTSAGLKTVKGLDLRNTHVGGLVDNQVAWPPQCQLYLDGFSFDHLGGRTGETSLQMSSRGEWWDTWARRDIDFSATPYLQLSSAFAALGNRDAANEIRYLEKSREQENSRSLNTWLVAASLNVFSGFGIGNYTFRALWWALGISLLGALYLRVRCRPARVSGRAPRLFIWYFGASLSRLLPIVEINKEFTDYFDDSRHKNLYPDQVVIFNIVAVLGFVLGGIVAAALTGFLQNP
jgi:hypothetical protein